MQPFEAFQPDGVILFSDILTPLPGMGIDFDIVESKAPSSKSRFAASAKLRLFSHWSQTQQCLL